MQNTITSGAFLNETKTEFTVYVLTRQQFYFN